MGTLPKGTVTFTEEELKGVPKDVISGYAKRLKDDQEVYDVTFKTPDIFPIVRSFSYIQVDLVSQYIQFQFKFAENPETRRIAQEGHESRLPNNVVILSKILALRRRISKLLGYRSWYTHACL